MSHDSVVQFSRWCLVHCTDMKPWVEQTLQILAWHRQRVDGEMDFWKDFFFACHSITTTLHLDGVSPWPIGVTCWLHSFVRVHARVQGSSSATVHIISKPHSLWVAALARSTALLPAVSVPTQPTTLV